MDTSGERHRGVLTADDMARWTPHIEAPLTYDYGRYTVCKTGPWGQGPVMLQQLALLKGFDLDGLDPAGPDFIHLLVECSKLAYADREVFYGDPDFVEVPMATLLSDAYNSERRKLIGRQGVARIAARLDRGFRRRGEAAPRPKAPGAGRQPMASSAPASRPSAGLARCAATPCISTSSIRPATWCRRRHRAAGCIPRRSFPSSASASARARRCSGSKKPSGLARARQAAAHHAVADTGAARRRAYLAWGSPGGDGQDQWITQMFLRHVHAGMNCRKRSTRRPGIPSIFRVVLAAHGAARRAGGRRPRAEETVAELKRRGHIVEVRPGLVGRPAHRRRARRPPPPRRRQSARHAGLRGGASLASVTLRGFTQRVRSPSRFRHFFRGNVTATGDFP
jgi:gamma-glutamyltranspeptidase/glutathione hydrolase